jgi:hypothetical protein
VEQADGITKRRGFPAVFLANIKIEPYGEGDGASPLPDTRPARRKSRTVLFDRVFLSGMFPLFARAFEENLPPHTPVSSKVF